MRQIDSRRQEEHNHHMNANILLCTGFLIGLFAAGSGAAADDGPDVVKLGVKLTDGSIVVGVPATNGLPVKTSYASMTVPLKAIDTIRFSDDRENVTLGFANGDQLVGVLNLQALKLRTLFGAVSVGLPLISSLEIRTGGAVPADLLRGLMVRYSFDRDTGEEIEDGSGSENHGTAHGTKWLALGKVGGGCEFPGATGWAEMSCNIAGPDFSFSLWVRIDQDVYGQAILGNYAAHDYGGPGFTLIQYGSPVRNGPYLQLNSGPRGSSINHKVSIADGKWHHIAGTIDEKTYTLYLDGAKVGSSQGRYRAPPRRPWIGKHHVMQGRPVGAWATLLDGAVDEILIFDRTLSEREVMQIHGAQK